MLPTLTKDERPRPRSLAYSMIARPKAPLWDDMRHSARQRGDGAEGGVEPHLRVEVEDAETVGADHPHPVAPDLADEPLLELRPFRSGLGKARRQHDQAAHAFLGAVVDDREHGRLGDGDRPPDRRGRGMSFTDG